MHRAEPPGGERTVNITTVFIRVNYGSVRRFRSREFPFHRGPGLRCQQCWQFSLASAAAISVSGSVSLLTYGATALQRQPTVGSVTVSDFGELAAFTTCWNVTLLERPPDRHADGDGDRDDTARGGNEGTLDEDGRRVGIVGVPPPEEGWREVDRNAGELEPRRPELELIAQPPGRPLRRPHRILVADMATEDQAVTPRLHKSSIPESALPAVLAWNSDGYVNRVFVPVTDRLLIYLAAGHQRAVKRLASYV